AEQLSALPEVGRVLTLQSFVPEDQGSKLATIDAMASFLGPVFLSTPKSPPSEAERQAAAERLLASLSEAATSAGPLAGPAARLHDALNRLQGPEAQAEY